MLKKLATLLFVSIFSCVSLISCGFDKSTDISLKKTSPKTEFSQTDNKQKDAESILPQGVVPVTWKPSSEHLIIESDEAKELYTKIKSGNYPTLEELKNSKVVAQIDALSNYYQAIYGITAEINTPERKKLREEIKQQFLKIGSARTESIDETTGKRKYVYDGKLSKDFKMQLVLGLPSSGKSTMVTDPDSEKMQAFILDCDVVKEFIPEFQESHGAAADAVHLESFDIMNDAMQDFFTGELKGTNVIIPIVADDFDKLMDNYIKPFENAGYTVTAKFVECEQNVSMARNLARELETGRIINSNVVLSFGSKPYEVYKKLSTMKNTAGELYSATN